MTAEDPEDGELFVLYRGSYLVNVDGEPAELYADRDVVTVCPASSLRAFVDYDRGYRQGFEAGIEYQRMQAG